MTIKLINMDELMFGLAPEDLRRYGAIVVRNIPKTKKQSLSFGGFEGDIQKTNFDERYALCRRVN